MSTKANNKQPEGNKLILLLSWAKFKLTAHKQKRACELVFQSHAYHKTLLFLYVPLYKVSVIFGKE